MRTVIHLGIHGYNSDIAQNTTGQHNPRLNKKNFTPPSRDVQIFSVMPEI